MLRGNFSCTFNGVRMELGEAMDQAVALIKSSRMPLITGLDVLGSRAQATAVQIAQKSRAIVDSSFDNRSRGPALAFVREGLMTCTLGEASRWPGCVVAIGSDPAGTHPRAWSKLTKDRIASEIAFIGEARSKTPCGHVVECATCELERIMMVLEAMVSAARLEIDAETTGYEKSQSLENLVGTLVASKSVVLCVPAQSQDPEFDALFDSVASLAKALASFCKVAVFILRNDANGVGAEDAIVAGCGFPFAADATRESVRAYGLECSTENMLARRETDLIVDFQISPRPKKQLEQFPEVDLIEFCSWSDRRNAGSLKSAKPQQLSFNGLEFLGDDFFRFDDLGFAIEGIESEPEAVTVVDLLNRVLSAI